MAGRVLVVTGPTATGKTRLGVMLARAIGGQVVSADSMQIYRRMDIGTAKPTPEETEGVPHHMIDVADPWEDYSVSRYVEEASRCCDRILEMGQVPIIVGGTGLYIESLLRGGGFAPRGEDGEARARYSAMYDEIGGERMLEELSLRDPQRAAKLHPNDKKRLVRAFEVLEAGQSLTDHDRESQAAPPRYESRVIVLNFQDRQELYSRIDSRVDQMAEAGLEREVRDLLSLGVPPGTTSMQAIGYKEMARAIAGEISVDQALEDIKRGSRRYAKRQISWCKRYPGALRIDWEKKPNFDEALRLSTDFWNELV